MRRPLLAVLLVLSPLVQGCDTARDLDTRTFQVQYLQPHEVQALLQPYVFDDRPEAAGVLSVGDNAVTIRETGDNLDKMARILEEYDRPRQRVRLRFQLIEADGARAPDPAIADVVAELERLFRFDGYRLMGESVLAADEGSIRQAIQETGWLITIGDVSPASPGAVRLRELTLWSSQSNIALETSVTVSAGQTLVLGNAPGREGQTVILAVKAERDGG